MIEWVSLLDSDLDAHLRGVAFGRRCHGEVSACGRFLVALLRSPHPLKRDSWELYGRTRAGGWAIKTCWSSRDGARAEAERQAGLGAA